jgi:hypothetical protein
MWINFDLGAWDDVLATIRKLSTRAIDESQLPAIAPPFRALVFAQRGRSREVASLPTEFLPVAREVHDPQVLVPALAAAAIVAHANGDAEAAHAAIVELEEDTRERPDWARLLHAVPLLRICVELGQLELGERLLDRPHALGARLEHAVVAGRAVSAEARGRTDEAARSYADAARRWRDYELPYEEAQALLGHWRCTREDDSLRRSQEIFTRLGAVVPEAAARAVRESTG